MKGHMCIINNVHVLHVSPAWPDQFHVGRSYSHLEPLTDPNIVGFRYIKDFCWEVFINEKDFRRALETYGWLPHRWITKLFNIDIDAKTVNNTYCPSMHITLLNQSKCA